MSLRQEGNTIDYFVKTKGRTYLVNFLPRSGGVPGAANQSAFGIIRGPSSTQLDHWRTTAAIDSGLDRILSHRTLLPYSCIAIDFIARASFTSRGRCGVQRSIARQSTMIESLGIAEPQEEPLLHYVEAIAVGIWPLKRVLVLECGD